MTTVSQAIARIAERAGALALEQRQTATIVVEKQGNLNFATSADIAAENCIRDALAKEFPGVPFVGEESLVGGSVPDTAFVVDPIDGTTNFAQGGDDWGVSIALVEGGEPVAGSIVIPTRRQVLRADVQHGAFLNETPVQLAQFSHAAHPRFALCGQEALVARADRMEQTWLLDLFRDYSYFLSSASAVVDALSVLEGRTVGSLALTSFAWDIAAGVVAIMSAGGVATTIRGDAITWSSARTGAVVMGSESFVRTIVRQAEAFQS